MVWMSAIYDVHKKKAGVELLYNSVHRKFNQLETRCGKESQHPAEGALRPPINQLETRCGRENQHPERLGPRPPVEQPRRTGKNAVMANRVGVNMLLFCSVSNSLSHTTLSIKWEVYFSKNCVARLHCVVVFCMHLHMNIQHIYIHQLCVDTGYNLEERSRSMDDRD